MSRFMRLFIHLVYLFVSWYVCPFVYYELMILHVAVFLLCQHACQCIDTSIRAFWSFIDFMNRPTNHAQTCFDNLEHIHYLQTVQFIFICFLLISTLLFKYDSDISYTAPGKKNMESLQNWWLCRFLGVVPFPNPGDFSDQLSLLRWNLCIYTRTNRTVGVTKVMENLERYPIPWN